MRLPVHALSLAFALMAFVIVLPLPADDGNGQVTLKVKVFKWSPGKKSYAVFPKVTLVASRGKEGERRRLENLDNNMDFTETNNDGEATFIVPSGDPWCLVSWEKTYVPEVLSLVGKAGEKSEISIALIATADAAAFANQNPGLRAAHAKLAEAKAVIPFAKLKENKKTAKQAEAMERDLAEQYKKVRPTSSLLLPIYFPVDDRSLTTLKDAAAKLKGVPIVCVVKYENADDAVRLQKAGVTVLGHVDARHSDKGNDRAKTAVKDWYSRVPALRGVFLDGQSADEKHLDYYDGIANHVRTVAPKQLVPLVLGNSGVDFPRQLLNRNINTATCFSNKDKVSKPEDVEVPDWIDGGFAPRTGVIVSHPTKDPLDVLVHLLNREVGYICLTDRETDRFGQLPSRAYLARTLAILQVANLREPGTTPVLPRLEETAKLLTRETRQPKFKGAVAEILLPRGAKCDIPAGQKFDVAVNIHFQGKNVIAYSRDNNCTFKWVLGRLFLVDNGNTKTFEFWIEEPQIGPNMPSNKKVALRVQIDDGEFTNDTNVPFTPKKASLVEIELKP